MKLNKVDVQQRLPSLNYKKPSWQSSCLRKIVLTTRGLQKASSALSGDCLHSLSTLTPVPRQCGIASFNMLPHHAALRTLINCCVRQWETPCFSCSGTGWHDTPLTLRVLHALTAKWHNYVNAAGSPPFCKRSSVAEFDHEHKRLKALVSY